MFNQSQATSDKTKGKKDSEMKLCSLTLYNIPLMDYNGEEDRNKYCLIKVDQENSKNSVFAVYYRVGDNIHNWLTEI